MEALGGVVFDRMVSDEELLSLYGASDLVWSCYSPHYNQSSGIFGRAFQLGKPSLVRESSYLADLADILEHPALRLPFGEVNSASERLTTWKPEPQDRTKILRKIKFMKERDLALLARTLRGQRAA